VPPKKKKDTESTTGTTAGQVLTKEQKLAAMNAISSKLVDKRTGEKIMRSMTECDSGVEVISTRTPSLDIALGVGGIPRGRVTEFFGPERSGKTTLAMQVTASAQELDLVILYIDSEHSLDTVYATSLGIDVDDPAFRIIQENEGDIPLDAATELLEAGAVDFIVIDSIANMAPRAQKDAIREHGVGKANVALKSRMWGQFIEQAIDSIHKGKVAMLNLQQMRVIMKPGQTPREDSATSSHSLRHNTSCRVKVSRKGDNEGTGNKTDETYEGSSQESIARVIKNKVGPPFRQGLFTIQYGKGVMYWDDLLDCCIVHGISGVSFSKMFEVIDTDTGETYPKFYRKQGLGADAFFEKYPELGVKLVDKLSDKVGIHLWDPIRGAKDRRVGPYSEEELEAMGATVTEFVPESDDDDSLEDDPIVDVL
jgi:recombination protein RecA